MRILASLLLVLFATVCSAQQSKIVFLEKKKPTAPLSQNIVFVIDASSTMRSNVDINKKFNKAWTEISKLLGSDEIYYSVYIFHGEGKEKFIPWISAHHSQKHRICPCLDGHEKVAGCTFSVTKQIIMKNTGVKSYGKVAMQKALREQVPKKLNKSWVSRQTLTLILITDGGFSEAADPSVGTGNFESLKEIIANEQASRLKKEMPLASIITVGIENTDPRWGTGTKRPDPECQEFLKKLGTKYGGGYYLLKRQSKKKKK